MTLALYHRTEVEVVEAECLPLSTRGGKPDPFVVVSYPELPSVKHRTKAQSNTERPVYAQRFVVEARAQVTTIHVAVFDRSEDADGLLASATLAVGGAGREVGCRWIQLNTAARGEATSANKTEWAPKLRLVWQCSSIMLAAEEAQGASDGFTAMHAAAGVPSPELMSVTKLVGDEQVAVTVDTALHPVQADRAKRLEQEAADESRNGGDPNRFSPLQAQILERLVRLEDTVTSFMSEIRVRLTKVESRVENVEAFIEGHGGRGGATNAARDERGTYWSMRPSSDPTSTSLALTGVAANTVAKATGPTHGGSVGGTSALDDIMKNPTRVSASDAMLVANYGFPPVKLPAALERRVTAIEENRGASTVAVEMASSPAATKRRVEAMTKAVGNSYNRMLQQ